MVITDNKPCSSGYGAKLAVVGDPEYSGQSSPFNRGFVIPKLCKGKAFVRPTDKIASQAKWLGLLFYFGMSLMRFSISLSVRFSSSDLS